jgi:eukaryotic-like serine/threonine-protein kinase
MTLAAGTRLGPYEVVSPVGAGGMGEVYRARDTRLERTVAVKVLPEHLSSSAEVRQRFEREARTISQISHPHICALYDVGNQDGVEYLVMEFLEGETLADRLLKGPLPADQILRYGIEIADALDKAHRQGIVHRDLKPGNVMLTKSGVKLLDFGLAKAVAPGSPISGLSVLPTQAGANLTQEGTILGTLQYMAPEQLEGKEADARTDIFAFGAVLYEMATGKKAFSGQSQASLIGAILHTDPPAISTLQPMTPPALDRVVKTCLAKDPEDRWQSAADVGKELKWIAEGASQAGVPATAVAGRRGREKLASSIAAIALLVAIALGVGYTRRAPKPLRLLRSTIELPEGENRSRLDSALELSPDGRLLALAAPGAGGKQPMYLRSLDGAAMQPLAGTDGATYPFWSPDGKSIAFFADGKLKRMEATGGAIQTICDAPQGRGGTWAPDGTIVFAPGLFGPLWRVSASGGPPTAAEAAIGAGESHRLPHFLPDGKKVLFYAPGPSRPEHGIYALDLASKKVRLIAHENSEGRFVPPGYLAFVREKNLMVQRFDPDSLRLSGEAVPVGEKQRFSLSRGTAEYSFAGPELLVYRAETPAPRSQLTWFDLAGRRLSTVGDPDTFNSISLAPDGKRAIVRTDAGFELWRIDLASGVRSRFALGVRVTGPKAVWSPDGRQLVFASGAGDSTTLQVEDADGGSPGKTVMAGQGLALPASWSPDGQVVAFFTQTEATRSFDIGILPMTGNGKPWFLVAGPADENGGTFSPDGRWLAYFSHESGQWEDYVVPYPGPGGKWQISSGGNGGPFCFWNGSGQLIILSPDRKVLAVDLTARGGSLEVGASHRIFGDMAMPLVALDYSPALQRFLIAVPVGEQKPAQITLLTNWTALLKKE